jgi:hypothetical protein
MEGPHPRPVRENEKTVNWEGNVPKGAIFHVAAFDKEGLRVTDVWETAEDLLPKLFDDLAKFPH